MRRAVFFLEIGDRLEQVHQVLSNRPPGLCQINCCHRDRMTSNHIGLAQMLRRVLLADEPHVLALSTIDLASGHIGEVRMSHRPVSLTKPPFS